ncbi:MAG TPA: hypothetical protein VF013_07655, partial [Candidatus Limnocylindria bacterium]
TGIERAILEERLAAERAAAIVAAEAERLAAAAAAREAAAQTVEPAEAEARPARRERRPRRAKPEARPVRSWAPLRGLASRYAVAALPVLAAAALWLAALAAGRLQLPDVQMRALALAVVLAGPGGALAAAGARAWFPRLAWLVTLTALLALSLIGTALLG